MEHMKMYTYRHNAHVQCLATAVYSCFAVVYIAYVCIRTVYAIKLNNTYNVHYACMNGHSLLPPAAQAIYKIRP